MLCCSKPPKFPGLDRKGMKGRILEEPNLIIYPVIKDNIAIDQAEFSKSELKIGKYFILDDISNNSKRIKKYLKSQKYFKKQISKMIDMECLTRRQQIKMYEIFKKNEFKKNLTIHQPPIEERWNFWVCSILNHVIINQVKFQELWQMPHNENKLLESTIEKDVPRTFRDHIFFQSKSKDISLGEETLYKVCKAISLFLEGIGYCQGLNLLIGFLLQASGAMELEVVNFSLNLMLSTKFMISGFYADEFPMVSFLKFFVKRSLKEKSKKLFEYIEKVGIPDDLWLSKWIICLMTTYLPRYHVARMMDFIFCRDIFAFGAYIAALLDLIKKFLIGNDMDDLNKIFNGLKGEFDFVLPEPEEIHKRAENKFFMGKEKIELIMKEFIMDEKSYGKEEFCKSYFPYLKQYLVLKKSRVISYGEIIAANESFDEAEEESGNELVDQGKFFRWRG